MAILLQSKASPKKLMPIIWQIIDVSSRFSRVTRFQRHLIQA